MVCSNDAERFPVRKNPRLKGYDYATPNYYFVTICTHQKNCIFGKPGSLNVCGEIARKGLMDMENHFVGLTIDKWVVMPNHIHAIIGLAGNGTSITTAVGLYKSFVTRQIHKVSSVEQVWQTSFHDHIIRGEKDYRRIWDYIDSNAANWLKDCFYIESE